MKKSLLLIPVIAVVLLLTMTQCKKNYNCGMRVVCYFSTNGLDTGKAVVGAILDIYPGAVAPGRTVHPAIEAGKKGVTGADGSYSHTMQSSKSTIPSFSCSKNHFMAERMAGDLPRCSS